MPTDLPVVSIVTICRNAAATIERTVTSVLGQTYPRIEYIVVDGQSSDGTIEIVRRHEGRIARFISEEDEGIADAFNKGLAQATGRYIAFVNADDWLAPDHVAIAVELLEAHSDKAFVYGDLTLYENGRPIFIRRGSQDYERHIRFNFTVLNHPSAVCRRRVFDVIGAFDPRYRVAMDYEWFLRLHRHGFSGLFTPRLRGNMEVGGISEVRALTALRENRTAAIANGADRLACWRVYVVSMLKTRLRLFLERRLAPHTILRLRQALFRSLEVVDSAPQTGPAARPPRILLHANYFRTGFGGTPEAILLLARLLGRQGFAVDLRSRDGFLADVGMVSVLPEAPPTRGDRPKPMADYCGMIIAGAWIPWALASALAARCAGIPVVFAPRGQLCRAEFTRLRDVRKMIYFLAVEVWAIILCGRIQFTSSIEARETLLPQWLKRRRGFVVPEPIDHLPIAARAQRKHAEPLHLGFIAQVSPRKGLRELVDGFLALMERRPDIDFELAIAGTPLRAAERYFENVRARAAAHSSGRRVKFMGQISGARRIEFYHDIDALVVPSRFESFGLAPVEALRFGCVVLTSAKVGALEFLDPSPALRILRDVSARAVASALEDLWNERRELAERRGEHVWSRLEDDAAFAPFLAVFAPRAARDISSEVGHGYSV